MTTTTRGRRERPDFTKMETMMERLPGIAWITLNNTSAADLIDIAARLQCGSVALLGAAPAPGFGRPIGPGDLAGVKAALGASGIQVSSLDILPIMPDFDPAAHDALLALGAELGAQRIGTVVFDDDQDRAADNLRAFAARARAHHLRLGVEFVSFSPLPSLAAAVGLIDKVADPMVEITFDVLHFVRAGGALGELNDTTLGKIGYLQICDGPAAMAPEMLMWEAGMQRLPPGAGSFDLAGIFAKMPPHLTIDIEVPMQDLEEQGIAPFERAQNLVAATAGVMAAARWRRQGGTRQVETPG